MPSIKGLTIEADGTVWFTVDLEEDGDAVEAPVTLARLKEWVDWIDRLHRSMTEMRIDKPALQWTAEEIANGAEKRWGASGLVVKLHTAEPTGGPTDGA